MNLLNKYSNGNYSVSIFDDGTKIRETESENFIAEFPENIDIKITNYCDAGCPMCHEQSTKAGEHASLAWEFINTLFPGTELAIGGGNPLDHPELESFLRKLKDLGVIANITVNQIHFMRSENIEKLLDYQSRGLIHGIGISLNRKTDKFLNRIKLFKNVVIHVINGYHSYDHIAELFDNDLKVLILGYKLFGRGVEYYSETVEKNKKDLYNNIHKVLRGFDIVSFDNLAIEQLRVNRLMLQEQWDQFYMGDDGNFTFYIDAVKGKFAKNSFSKERYDVLNNVKDMFQFCRNLG